MDKRKRHKGNQDEKIRGRSLVFVLALEDFILGRNVEKDEGENGEKSERIQTWIY